MKHCIYISFMLVLGSCFFPSTSYAQTENDLLAAVNKDDLGNVTDAFQEYFFEALKQKAIGNHEKAIALLEKCTALSPEKAILYVELGKNHEALKNYSSAEKFFKTALQKRPESPHVRIALYEVYAAAENYDDALQVLKKLVDFHPDYYMDMANLYMMVKRPEAALKTLNTLDSLRGPSESSANLRRDIFNATGNEAGQIAYLQSQIAANPEDQENYLRLINLYGENQAFEEAFTWAKKLQEKHPDSPEVQLALSQLYFAKKEYDKGIASLKKVLSSKELKETTKVKVLQAFVAFVKKHPTYEEQLQEVLDLAIKTGESEASKKELGDFYLSRDKEKALQYYTEALENNFNDVKTIENTLLLQLDLQQNENALALSKKALAIFPARPLFYLSQGIAFNRLQKYADALESLDLGLSYLIDAPTMKVDFFQQMAIAHRGMAQEDKAVLYEKKAMELKNKL